MSDFIPSWTAVGVGIAQGEKERRDKANDEKTKTDAADADATRDDSDDPASRAAE